MLYPLGQALFYVLIVLVVLAVCSIPLARWAGKLKTRIAHHQHEVQEAFKEGSREEQ